MTSEWMKVMLEEISRKKSEAAEARAEEHTRREESRLAPEHGRADERGRSDASMTREDDAGL
jgi:hypothetical protein